MGNGYTRQSAASIIDDGVIEAADHNAEFNALESAFNASTGHSHDGTLGEGPQINLTTSVTGILPQANGGTGANTAQGALDALFSGGKHVDDDLFHIAASADNTRRLRFDVGDIGNNTTRTFSVPNLDITISEFIVDLLDDTTAVDARTTLGVQPLDTDLTALAALNATGFAVRTAADTWAQRIVEGTSGQVTVTNGNGISGNPVISLPANVTITGTFTSNALAATSGNVSGTMTAGTFSGSGASLTNLNASNLASGTVPSTRLPVQSQGTWEAGVGTTESAISPAKLQAAIAILGMPTGAVIPFAGVSSPPSGFLYCYGQAISRTTYAALYTVIGTTYGAGNGSTTFNVPDLRGRVPAGQDDMGGVSANRLTGQSGGVNGDVLGATGGAETHTLLSSQMAAHTHTFSGTSSSAGSHSHTVSGSTASAGAHSHTYQRNAGGASAGGSGGGLTQGTLTNYTTTTDGAHTHTFSGSTNSTGSHSHTYSGTTSSVGSGSAHNNVQPTIILNYIIKY